MEKVMLPEQAFQEGWDYPPNMGAFGILSPRTCGKCPMRETLWWRLTAENFDPANLTDADVALVERIHGEPASITPPVEGGA